MAAALTLFPLAAGCLAASIDDLPEAPERRCAPYDARAYAYPSDLDRRLVEGRGWSVDRAGRLSGWLPDVDVCAYARRWIAVKAKWGLSADAAERAALASALEGCPP